MLYVAAIGCLSSLRYQNRNRRYSKEKQSDTVSLRNQDTCNSDDLEQADTKQPFDVQLAYLSQSHSRDIWDDRLK